MTFDQVRYFLAVVLVVSFPPAFGFWFVVHPLIGFWRRMGPWITYGTMFPAMLATMYGLFQWRSAMLTVDYGTRWPLVALGLLLYGLAAVVERKCRRYLTLRTLVGVPELKAEDEGPGTLLNEGIYSRVRHPRYLGVMLGGFGIACIANYRAPYLMMVGLVPVVFLLTLIEERELRGRFGNEYTRYAEAVPRIIPRPTGGRVD